MNMEGRGGKRADNHTSMRNSRNAATTASTTTTNSRLNKVTSTPVISGSSTSMNNCFIINNNNRISRHPLFITTIKKRKPTISILILIPIMMIIIISVSMSITIFLHKKVMKRQTKIIMQQHHQQQVNLMNDNTNHKKGVAYDRKQHQKQRIRTNITIFYNIYIPYDNEDLIQNAIRIIKEQIYQIGQSDVFLMEDNNNNNNNNTIFLYYNTIGNFQPISNNNNNNNSSNNDMIPTWCRVIGHPKLICIHLQHYDNGDESVTLQSLYNYCQKIPTATTSNSQQQQQQQQIQQYRVTYIHSKGSYHPNKVNDPWRRALTAAAVHYDCIQPPIPSCNLCGLQFYTLFTFFIPGNMWTADCTYINQLIPPIMISPTNDNNSNYNTSSGDDSSNMNESTFRTNNNYQQLREKTVEYFLLNRVRGIINATLLLRDRRDYYGLDRYSTEHWIGSHPNIIPCDLDPIGNLQSSIFHKQSIWQQSPFNTNNTNNKRNKTRKQQQYERDNSNLVNTLVTDTNNDVTIENDDDHDDLFQFSMAPRHRGFVVGNVEETHEALLDDETIRLREYYLLPGHLLKWSTLYNGTALPSNDSWIWSWFPDGYYWRDGMIRYGIDNVVSKLNEKYAFHIGIPDDQINTISSAFFPTTDVQQQRDHRTTAAHTSKKDSYTTLENSLYEHAATVNLTLDYDSITKYVVFYHIALSDDDTNDPEKNALEIVEDQFEILATSYAASSSKQNNQRLTVFLTVAGYNDSDDNKYVSSVARMVLEDICAQYTNLHCRLLHNLDRNYEGETLRQLHNYCQMTTSHNASDSNNHLDDYQNLIHDTDAVVIHINNLGPVQLRREEGSLRNLILHMTMAVTDTLCLRQQPSPPSHACNVCGLIFYTIWTFFFPGNMFAAKCSYVKDLLSPFQYEYNMKHTLIGKILLMKLRTQLTMTLLPTVRPDYVGLDRYSIDHWIGSHPDILPCDLTDENHDFEYWDQTTPVLKQQPEEIQNVREKEKIESGPPFEWSMAPRHSGWPSLLTDEVNDSVEAQIMSNKSLRVREYYFLAGHIVKWYELYNRVPSFNSWVWTWFQDGNLWKDAVLEHGKEAVDIVTAEYTDDGM